MRRYLWARVSWYIMLARANYIEKLRKKKNYLNQTVYL